MILLKKSITIFLFVFLALGNFSQVLAFSDGTEDTDFYTNLGTGSDNDVFRVIAQPDGKILLSGDFNSFNGETINRLMRLNSDGTPDTTFNTNLGTGFDDYIYEVALQDNGKILVGGSFLNFNGNERNLLVRLNSDGTEDADFYTNLGTGFDGNLYDIVVQPDGKILVSGDFLNFNGDTHNTIVRLNSDGTEDTDFYTNLGAGFDDTMTYDSVAVQDDGKILVGGYFSNFNGHERNKLIRLNSDGTEDTDFYTNLGTGFVGNYIASVAIQNDGDILIGGDFTQLNGNNRNRLVRLNSDGTEDTDFYTNLGTSFANGNTYTVLQSDGDILVYGSFTSFNGNVRNRLVRLNSDGSEDTDFYTKIGLGFDSLTHLSLQSDGDILICGLLTFNGNDRNKLIRLTAPTAPDPEPAPRSHSSSGSRPAYRPLFVAKQVAVVPAVNTVRVVNTEQTSRCEIKKTLKLGNAGEEVKCLQKILGGVDNDGFFGPKTKNAVIFFQKNNPPLVPDGIVGPLTRNKLQ